MDHDGLEQLVELDGERFFVSEDGRYWVKFDIHEVAASPARPTGLAYSLTLHGPNDERLVGFDNAHPVPPNRLGQPRDHTHIGDRVRIYCYTNARELLTDFWSAVYSMLQKRGIE